MLTDSRNYLAANELAVLLAKNGYLQSARTLLQRSVAGSPQPAAWHNLAVVHRYLGEKQLSALAETKAPPQPNVWPRRTAALPRNRSAGSIRKPSPPRHAPQRM